MEENNKLAARKEAQNREQLLLEENIMRCLPALQEANFVAEQMQRNTFMSIKILTEKGSSADNFVDRTFVKVLAVDEKSGAEGLWSLEEFLERVCIMREIYHHFMLTKQTSDSEEEDPFFIDTTLAREIGDVRIYLEPLHYFLEIEDTFPMHDNKGGKVGFLHVKITPSPPELEKLERRKEMLSLGCSEEEIESMPFEQSNLPERIGKSLMLNIYISTAKGLPVKQSANVYCEYKFWDDEKVQQTDRRDGINVDFEYHRQLEVGVITQEFCDFVVNGVMKIEVFGSQSKVVVREHAEVSAPDGSDDIVLSSVPDRANNEDIVAIRSLLAQETPGEDGASLLDLIRSVIETKKTLEQKLREMQQSQDNIASSSSKVTSKEQEIEQAEKDIEIAKQKYEQEHERYEQLIKDREAQANEIQRLSGLLSSTSSTDALAAQEAEITRLREQLQTVQHGDEQEISRLQNALASAERERAELEKVQQALTAAEQRAAALQAESQELEKFKHELKLLEEREAARKSQHELELARLRDELKVAQDRNETLRAAAEQEKELVKLKESLKAAEEKNEQIRRQAEQENELRRLREQLEQAQKKEQQFKKVEEEKMKIEVTITQHTEEVKRKEVEVKMMLEEKERKDRELKEAQSQIEALQRQLKEEADKKPAYYGNEELGKLRAELEQREAEMKRLQEELKLANEKNSKTCQIL
eukprot:TRINITY_DN6574_c0_g2_i1.p1 TRINITY_DN6574_c0_g2~~TRINITY_DN6574_c0_g2_i1.p1  ORF type:complete len:773 (-),score=235.01 TRINITY_DN6574_c0_g2_i1:129-2234(-)